jgi:hypothetical protein
MSCVQSLSLWVGATRNALEVPPVKLAQACSGGGGKQAGMNE